MYFEAFKAKGKQPWKRQLLVYNARALRAQHLLHLSKYSPAPNKTSSLVAVRLNLISYAQLRLKNNFKKIVYLLCKKLCTVLALRWPEVSHI